MRMNKLDMPPEAIEPRVIRCIAESLAIDPASVTPDARLIGDLDADSLDFIDILFGLEREFALKLRSADVDAFLRADFSERALVDGRYVRPEDVDRLAEWMPTLAEVLDKTHVTPAKVFGHISVGTFVRIVESAAAAD